MDKEILEKYKLAGRIAAEVKAEALRKARPGLKLLELAEFIEKRIIDKGGHPAFPVNISVNEIAAHYTPAASDIAEIREGDLVKIDIGVHVDGYIGDLAFTYCSRKDPLIDSVEKALAEGLKRVKPGAYVSDIGEAIQKSVEADGFGLIVNLTGHGLDKYVFHGMPSIPNTANNSEDVFEEGDVIAIEPFVCKANGFVRESGSAEIFRYLRDRPARLPEARQIIQLSRDKYHGLPFAKRWLLKAMSPVKLSMALRQLEDAVAIEKYPILKETTGMRIAQAEHTMIVAERPVVTTKTEGE